MEKINLLLKSALIALAVLFSQSELYAQQSQAPTDFYPIVMVNTADPGIGGEVFKTKLGELFQGISTSTGMTPHLTVIPYPFNYKDFEDAVAAIPSNRNSVVMIYVYDHSENASGTNFPLVGFNQGDKKFTDMHTMLKQRGNRLTISIIEACNQGNGQSTLGENLTDYYKELFMDATGDIIACSSKKGQWSLASNRGGNFGNVFLACVTQYGDWHELSDKVNERTQKEAKKYTCDTYPVPCNCVNDRCNQEPYWEINVSLNPSRQAYTPLYKECYFKYSDIKYSGLSLPTGINEGKYSGFELENILKQKNCTDWKKILDEFYTYSFKYSDNKFSGLNLPNGIIEKDYSVNEFRKILEDKNAQNIDLILDKFTKFKFSYSDTRFKGYQLPTGIAETYYTE